MAKKNEDDAVPDAASSLRQLSRLASLWRAADHESELNPVQWDALRYLAQANRFSNSPGALSKYLGVTKGTISQSLSTLEKKALVVKSPRGNDQRSVGLALTETGQALLAHDPRGRCLAVLRNVKPKTQKRFAQALGRLLADITLQLQSPSFGTCGTCTYLRERGRDEAALCMKFEVALNDTEQHLLCVAHQVR